MSGRWLTTIAVSGCLLMVAFALWQRSQDTRQVRKFWGAQQAHLIQTARSVRWHVGPAQDYSAHPESTHPVAEQSSDTGWTDLSHAPGLVHLRATLVEDRYYDWSKLSRIEPAALVAGSLSTSSKPGDLYTLQFSDDTQLVELTIDVQTGLVINVSSGQSVPLIRASRKAIADYLPKVTEVQR